MPPLHRDHFISGPYTLKADRLTFKAEHQTAYDARHAKEAGRDFTVCVSESDGLKEMTGKVVSIDLVPGVKPAKWEIVMRVSSFR